MFPPGHIALCVAHRSNSISIVSAFHPGEDRRVAVFSALGVRVLIKSHKSYDPCLRKWAKHGEVWGKALEGKRTQWPLA